MTSPGWVGGLCCLGAARNLDAHDTARRRNFADVEVGLHLDHKDSLIFFLGRVRFFKKNLGTKTLIRFRRGPGCLVDF